MPEPEWTNLLVTTEFENSLDKLTPPLTSGDIDGVLRALDDLDSEPTNFRNRLHKLDRELAGWWSLTPPQPANQSLRILVRPEQTARGGV